MPVRPRDVEDAMHTDLTCHSKPISRYLQDQQEEIIHTARNPSCRTGTADEGACSDATLRRRGRGGGTRYTESGNIGRTKIPEYSGNFPEYSESSGNIPEKTDKEKKIKEKQRKSSSTPPPQPSGALTEEEARVLLSSTVLGEDRSSKPDIARHQPSQADVKADVKAEEEKQRNPQGLINTLRPYNLSQREPGGGTAALTAWRNRKSCLVYSCRNARKQTSQNAASIPVEATAGCNGTSGRRKPGR